MYQYRGAHVPTADDMDEGNEVEKKSTEKIRPLTEVGEMKSEVSGLINSNTVIKSIESRKG